ncbi:hypothetical protein M0802_006176 [Mischocyttarus mexicanus]|nr:hypothetical protein M0802_006176 [Mischocyttarus mexicanus]
MRGWCVLATANTSCVSGSRNGNETLVSHHHHHQHPDDETRCERRSTTYEQRISKVPPLQPYLNHQDYFLNLFHIPSPNIYTPFLPFTNSCKYHFKMC